MSALVHWRDPCSTLRVPQTALAYARVWHHVDASERVLGKLAERIALVLMGKHKPIFDPSGTHLLVTTLALGADAWQLS